MVLKPNKKIVLGLASISLLASLGACTRQRVYYLNENNVYKDWTVFATNDKTNERFDLEFKPNKDFVKYTFFFIFSYGKENNVIKSTDQTNELTYTFHAGGNINFNEEGSYIFSGRTRLNVSYANASQEVKQAISDREYSLQFGCGHYIPDREQ